MSKVHIGTSVLSRDLVWCDCGRGLSLSGKWLYCPSCGNQLDQESYRVAVDQAIANRATLYRNTEEVEKLATAHKYFTAIAGIAGNITDARRLAREAMRRLEVSA